jgi:hypothetical protein
VYFPSYAQIVNLCLIVVLCVNSQLLISLSLSEVEDTGLKPLRIEPVSILGVKVVDYVVRLAWSECLPSDIQLLIRDYIGQVRDEGGCNCCCLWNVVDLDLEGWTHCRLVVG